MCVCVRGLGLGGGLFSVEYQSVYSFILAPDGCMNTLVTIGMSDQLVLVYLLSYLDY